MALFEHQLDGKAAQFSHQLPLVLLTFFPTEGIKNSLTSHQAEAQQFILVSFVEQKQRI